MIIKDEMWALLVETALNDLQVENLEEILVNNPEAAQGEFSAPLAAIYQKVDQLLEFDNRHRKEKIRQILQRGCETTLSGRKMNLRFERVARGQWKLRPEFEPQP